MNNQQDESLLSHSRWGLAMVSTGAKQEAQRSHNVIDEDVESI